jgi:hypothetical protein
MFINQIVTPTIADFEVSPSSVRHAFLACVVAFHTFDYVAREKSESGTALRQAWGRQSDDFKTLDDIAHALKHVQVGPTRRRRVAHEAAHLR